MRFDLKSFDELSPSDLYQILNLRQEVFIIEQDCIYNDIDGADPFAIHLLLKEEDNLIAYLRFFPPSIKVDDTSMGRIVVKKTHRGTEVGPALINKGIQICLERFPDSAIHIEAQAALKEYYSKFGFEAIGEVYVWDGIDHIEMILK